jgi:hypothetical protein
MNDWSLAIELLGVSLAGAAILYMTDVISLRFARDPRPDRVILVSFLNALSLVAVLMFYGGMIAAGVVVIVPPIDRALQSAGYPSLLRAAIALVFFAGFLVAGIARRRLRRLAQRSEHISGNDGTTEIRGIVSVPANSGTSLLWFSAMQYYALILNRTYKVFIADSMLCGAKVLGLVASPAAPSSDMSDAAYWAATLSATLYDRLDVTSRTFLRLNISNFQIKWADIVQIDYKPGKKWGMGNVPHSGRIVVRLKSGRSRELILLGEQNGEALKKILDQAVISGAARAI